MGVHCLIEPKHVTNLKIPIAVRLKIPGVKISVNRIGVIIT